MFRVHMKAQEPRNYREAFMGPDEVALVRSLLEHLLGEGFLMINTGTAAISTAMSERDIDDLVEAMRRWFMKSKDELPAPGR
jgi:glutamate-1-semialdehyde 2,1-aminomutase